MTSTARSDRDVVIEVDDLGVMYPAGGRFQRVVDGVSLKIHAGETVGLVGESGCGKSTLARAVLRLVPAPGIISGGRILFDGKDILPLREHDMRRLRGGAISMIFQNPMSALNPVLSIGQQITESLAVHTELRGSAARRRAADLLAMVGISSPAERLAAYPHQFSGGMRQRVMIAMAISCNPRLLIADEPTTALDVTVQAQILDLLDALRRELSMAILFISHDLGAVASIADRVNVMYAGKIVEEGTASQVLQDPAHPYTDSLLGSIASLSAPRSHRLPAISGSMPGIFETKAGCAFQPRCRHAVARCAEETPPLADLPDDRAGRCWRAMEGWRPRAGALRESGHA